MPDLPRLNQVGKESRHERANEKMDGRELGKEMP